MRPSRSAWSVVEAPLAAFQIQLLQPEHGHLFTPSFQLQNLPGYRYCRSLLFLRVATTPTSAPVLHHAFNFYTAK